MKNKRCYFCDKQLGDQPLMAASYGEGIKITVNLCDACYERLRTLTKDGRKINV